MTANERRLFNALIACAFAAVLVPAAYSGIERLREARRSIDSYEAAFSKIERFDQDADAVKVRIARLKESFGDELEPRQAIPFSAFVTEVRALLLRFGIEPLRYQTVGSGEDEAVEFVLRCDAFALMEFLRESSRKDRAWAVPSLSIHPEGSGRTVNATVRIRHAK